MSQSETEQARWFASEVQPHEAALRAYLHARFPSLPDHDDFIQETYSRLLRAQAAGKVRYPKAFMFSTARNAALDFFRRNRGISSTTITHFDADTVLEDAPSVADVLSQQQELDILAEAVQALPDRCRQVVLLRYLDGLSYKEISMRLSISTETVKTHMAKGMRRCAEHFEERGLLKTAEPPSDPSL